jgi:hypothetical protein
MGRIESKKLGQDAIAVAAKAAPLSRPYSFTDSLLVLPDDAKRWAARHFVIDTELEGGGNTAGVRSCMSRAVTMSGLATAYICSSPSTWGKTECQVISSSPMALYFHQPWCFRYV